MPRGSISRRREGQNRQTATAAQKDLVKVSVALTQEAPGRYPVLTELTREEARAVRDHMLD
jgi:hypothetical protein